MVTSLGFRGEVDCESPLLRPVKLLIVAPIKQTRRRKTGKKLLILMLVFRRGCAKLPLSCCRWYVMSFVVGVCGVCIEGACPSVQCMSQLLG